MKLGKMQVFAYKEEQRKEETGQGNSRVGSSADWEKRWNTEEIGEFAVSVDVPSQMW